jgi:hypothetical protein
VSEWFRDSSSNHGMLVKTYGQLAQKVVVVDAGELVSIKFICIIIKKLFFVTSQYCNREHKYICYVRK